MRTHRVVAASVLALATVALPLSVAQAKTSVPRPLAGHYKIEKGFSEVKSGSLVVGKSRATFHGLKFIPLTPYCTTTTPIRVLGSFHLHNVADNKHGASDNTPDWSLTKNTGGSRKVKARQGGKTIHGSLTLTFGSKNGTHKPVKYVQGQFVDSNCSVLLGGVHS
jgi:hypothetical protein